MMVVMLVDEYLKNHLRSNAHGQISLNSASMASNPRHSRANCSRSFGSIMPSMIAESAIRSASA